MIFAYSNMHSRRGSILPKLGVTIDCQENSERISPKCILACVFKPNKKLLNTKKNHFAVLWKNLLESFKENSPNDKIKQNHKFQ
jgi:hypothetical protein